MTKKGCKSLWSDTFTIEISVVGNPGNEFKETIQYTGSLKGAIRYILRDYRKSVKGNINASFHNSNGDYIKEIGL